MPAWKVEARKQYIKFVMKAEGIIGLLEFIGSLS